MSALMASDGSGHRRFISLLGGLLGAILEFVGIDTVVRRDAVRFRVWVVGWGVGLSTLDEELDESELDESELDESELDDELFVLEEEQGDQAVVSLQTTSIEWFSNVAWTGGCFVASTLSTFSSLSLQTVT